MYPIRFSRSQFRKHHAQLSNLWPAPSGLRIPIGPITQGVEADAASPSRAALPFVLPEPAANQHQTKAQSPCFEHSLISNSIAELGVYE